MRFSAYRADRRRFVARAALLAMALPLTLSAGGTAAQTLRPSDFTYGADISSVTEMEAKGRSYLDTKGQKADLYDLVKERGIDSVRLRVWVNPEGGWSAPQDVLAKAKRARDHGMRIMIDFHYSDNWADPAKQFKPAAWNSFDTPKLAAAVRDHTQETLSLLKANGIDVAWVQVGNEITNGLLWPEGKTPNFANIAQITNAGYDVVKSIYPGAEVIIHIDNGWDTKKALWWFDNFKKNNGKVDVIGLSYYPFFTPSKKWKVESPKVSTTMKRLIARFDKPVMMVEIGYDFEQPEEARAMLTDMIARNKALGAMGRGVVYWEPGTMPSESGYRLGATDRTNRLTTAMDAFRH